MPSLWEAGQPDELTQMWTTHTYEEMMEALDKTQSQLRYMARKLGLPHKVRPKVEKIPKPTHWMPRQYVRPVKCPPAPTPRNISIIDLEVRDCRWPTSEARGVPGRHLFCGNRAIAGRDYCPHHDWVSVRKGTPS